MKYVFSLFLLISMSISAIPASADFFNEQIVGADPETAMIEDITLDNITLKDSKEIARYNNTAYFVAGIKSEAIKRFNDGTISYYRQHDIITALDSFVYTMNQYFSYEKRYEQTRNGTYKERAQSYLQDSRWDYARLRAALKKSTNTIGQSNINTSCPNGNYQNYSYYQNNSYYPYNGNCSTQYYYSR